MSKKRQNDALGSDLLEVGPSSTTLRETVRTLPDLPGIYQFKDAKGTILYIGKAKSLKKRVTQYFTTTRLEPLKQEMMKVAFSVETIIVKNETEALVLEGTLIHKHQPPYNVRLVDDSSYLYIKISKDAYPKVSLERKVATDGAWYRGPYPNSRAVRQTLKEARKLFPWCDKIKSLPASLWKKGGDASVSLLYSKEGEGGFRRPCFAYHIGLCPGICVGAISLEEYQNNFVRLKKFLDGDTDAVLNAITERMNQLSRQQQYEKAGTLRDRIKAIQQTMIPQDVITARDENADIFGLAHHGGHGSIALLQLRQGRIIGRQIFSLLLPDKKEEKEIWEEFLAQYLPTAQGGAKIIYLPTQSSSLRLPTVALAKVGAIGNPSNDIPKEIGSLGSPRHQGYGGQAQRLAFEFPVRGWKKQLIDMANINAQESLNKSETELQSPQNLLNSIKDLQEKLNLPTLPKRIETYDISSIQGKLATASMVVFIDGKSAPSEYRKFKIINDGEPNDVGMMREVLTRRLARLQGTGIRVQGSGTTNSTPVHSTLNPVPSLIVLDGGKPQLNAGISTLKKLNLNIPLISLAKREEEIFMRAQGRDGAPRTSCGCSRGCQRRHISVVDAGIRGQDETIISVLLPRTSHAFYLMQRMRDEAHRFTISYHRLLRKKRMTKSILEEIPGIGPRTRKKLLHAFGSLSGIRAVSVEEIEKVLGTKKKAEVLVEFLKK